MKNPFTLSWGKPQKAPERCKYTEIPPGDTLTRLSAYSETVLKILRNNQGPDISYGEAAVKRLSDDINAGRLSYDDAAKIKIANLYGSFLGTSIIQTYKSNNGRWVQSEDGIGIVFSSSAGSLTKIAYPITRVFKQIDHGEEYSVYSYFMAIPEFIASDPMR